MKGDEHKNDSHLNTSKRDKIMLKAFSFHERKETSKFSEKVFRTFFLQRVRTEFHQKGTSIFPLNIFRKILKTAGSAIRIINEWTLNNAAVFTENAEFSFCFHYFVAFLVFVGRFLFSRNYVKAIRDYVKIKCICFAVVGWNRRYLSNYLTQIKFNRKVISVLTTKAEKLNESLLINSVDRELAERGFVVVQCRLLNFKQQLKWKEFLKMFHVLQWIIEKRFL